MLVRPALGVAFAALALALALVLSQEEPRLAASNGVADHGAYLVLPAGAELCQGREHVPDDSSRLRFGTVPEDGSGPALTLRIRSSTGSHVAGAELPRGYDGGLVTVALDRELPEAFGGEVCVRNRGADAVGFGSAEYPPEQGAVTSDTAQPARMRIEYFRSGSESWWQLAGTVANRFGLGKSLLLGSWALPAAGILLLLAIGVSARLLVRSAST